MENENENENGNEVAVQTAITELIENKLDEAFGLHAKMRGGGDDEASFRQYLVADWLSIHAKIQESVKNGDLNNAINDTIGDYDFDDILENGIDNYNFDYKMENAIDNYDIDNKIEDAIEDALSNINIGDHVDIDESVQEAIMQWVDNGCEQVNRVAKKLYNRAIGGNYYPKLLQPGGQVILTQNQFDRIMEVVDFIRPAVVAREWDHRYTSDIVEELIAHTGGDGAEAIKIVSDAVIAKATDEAQVIMDNITKGLSK